MQQLPPCCKGLRPTRPQARGRGKREPTQTCCWIYSTTNTRPSSTSPRLQATCTPPLSWTGEQQLSPAHPHPWASRGLFSGPLHSHQASSRRLKWRKPKRSLNQRQSPGLSTNLHSPRTGSSTSSIPPDRGRATPGDLVPQTDRDNLHPPPTQQLPHQRDLPSFNLPGDLSNPSPREIFPRAGCSPGRRNDYPAPLSFGHPINSG